jgi:hypothetical protein
MSIRRHLSPAIHRLLSPAIRRGFSPYYCNSNSNNSKNEHAVLVYVHAVQSVLQGATSNAITQQKAGQRTAK